MLVHGGWLAKKYQRSASAPYLSKISVGSR
jgi:hypothetical protein